MSKFHKRIEMIYMDLRLNMSTKAMSAVLYAGFETGAAFTTLWHMNRKAYTRNQNSRNSAFIKVHIHPDEIALFEKLSGHKLQIPQKIMGV